MKYLNKLTILSVMIFIWGCGDFNADSKEALPSTAQIQKADSAILVLGKTLKMTLVKKMNESGIDSAAFFCSENAQMLTQLTSRKLEGIDLKRTSARTRNPMNIPDSLEQEVLDFFAAEIEASGTYPEYFVQTYKSGGEIHHRYYKPMKIEALCLNCHGNDSQVPVSIKQLVEKNYPDDKAIGYQLGDFRGLIRADFKNSN